MYGKTTLALAGAFLSLAAAVPMNKRDLVWVTMTQEDIVTVPVTKTIWVEPGQQTEAAPTSESVVAHYGHGHGHVSKATSTIQSTVTVKPVSSPEESAPSSYEAPPAPTSAYVAPLSTSTSVYEAPSTSSVYVAPVVSSTSVYVAPVPSTTSTYVAPPPSTTSTYVAPPPSTTSTYVAPPPSTTSTWVAPTTSSTSEYVAPPAPTTTEVAPTTTSSAAEASQTYSSGGSSSPMAGKSYTGDLTYYSPGLGACGISSGDSDHIVAISKDLYDLYTPNGNPNNNPLCGSKVSITGSSGSSYVATIVDRCVGCLAGDLDLSPDFFKIVEPTGDGRVHNVDWKFL